MYPLGRMELYLAEKRISEDETLLPRMRLLAEQHALPKGVTLLSQGISLKEAKFFLPGEGMRYIFDGSICTYEEYLEKKARKFGG